MSYMSIRSNVSRNSLADVFTHISTYAQPECSFTFWTDKTSTGYCSALQSAPRTVRQILGGIEGSILDAYGGEYEWDTWTVRLWANRGQLRDFTIRYGVNMLEYEEEYDSTGCYSTCRPFWTDGTTTIVGDKQTSGGVVPSGREQCVPLDLSEKFENAPTKAQVEAMAVSIMNSTNPTSPAQNITVSFVRLQDMGELSGFQNLLKCSLCDTINVIFPDFNSSGMFKIVRTTWNVLTGRYDEMELGDLSTSLSEALGINDIQQSSRSTIEQIQAKLEELPEVRTGSIASTSVTANSYKDVSVTFSPAMTGVPIVVASLISTSTAGAIGSLEVATNNITASGFTCRIFNAGASNREPAVNWIAIYT
jgi:phage-related protein